MRVIPIAHTCIDWIRLEPIVRGTKFAEAAEEFTVEGIDHLAEFAGRSCYKAYDRKRAETATTTGYVANILRQGHYSVLEHASVTFWVEGVSRSLLVELERHRFLSFSVESQRYVDQAESHREPVIPPALAATPAAGPYAALMTHYGDSLDHYTEAVSYLMAKGYPLKQAREAARAFLPNATPVDMVVSGNIRCWRDVIAKRYHVAADAEIREFAAEVLHHLREIAPASVQDIPNQPYADF